MDGTPAGDADRRADGVAASGPRGPARGVTPGGTSANRNTVPANAAGRGTPRSSPAGGTAVPENPQVLLLGAGPRAAAALPRQPLPAQLQAPRRRVAARVPGNGDFVRDAAPCPARWTGTAGPPANAASAGQLAGRRRYNTALGDEKVGTIVHNPSTDRLGVESDAEGLARPGSRSHTEVGPREVLLPLVKPRSGAANSSPRRSSWIHHRLLPA